MMRYTAGVNSRLLRAAQVEKARAVLFGHERGLPGERWLARPLVARDMLQWYFPSKFGLQDFRLDEYYTMQAERFRKRQPMPWVDRFRALMDTVQARKEEVGGYLRTVSESEYRDKDEVKDLHAMYLLLGNESVLSFSVGNTPPVPSLRDAIGGNCDMPSTVAISSSGESRQADSKILQQALLRERHVWKRLSTGSSGCDADTSSLYVNKRHRFVDPLFRRRRLKWMERFLAGMNNAKEIKYNRHFTRHPDEQKQWPSNLGSVTVRWPNRRN